MPKVRERSTVPGAKSAGIRNKFRLGLRKNGISAHSMPTKDLIEIYFDPKVKKDRYKAEQVLHLRNVIIPDSLPTENEETAE